MTPQLSALLAACCALASARAEAAEVVLAPTRDNTLYQEYIENSNGAGYLFAGRAGGGGIRRALLHFDVAGSIPVGARIDEVRLDLSVSRAESALAAPAQLRRLLADWGEAGSNAGERAGQGTQVQPGDTTWTLRFHPVLTWSVAGGEFEAAASGSARAFRLSDAQPAGRLAAT
jgi:hypothetical protein